MKRIRTAAYYAAQGLTVALALFVSLRLWQKDLRIPLHTKGDSLFWTVIVKAVSEDGWGHSFHSLGMPVGADLRDWPMGMPLDFTIMRLLAALLGGPGAAINAYWLLSIVATGLSATLCLRWLRFAPPLAFGLGALYGLLPYTFGHHLTHIPLVFHFVPPIALLALQVAEGDVAGLGRGQRLALLSACALQGLSYVYYSFFSCILLAAAAGLGWARTRQGPAVRTAALGVILLCAGSVASLTPSLFYWSEHGRNPELAYKTPADADAYGLRIRNLLTPIPDHPIPAFRRAAEAVAAAHLPDDDSENAWARLGTVGSLGFFVLLAVSVGAVAGLFGEAPLLLRSAAALNLVVLLVAQVGGFGSLFNLFVLPDIRVYSRMVVFIAFFSLVAFGIVASSLAARLMARRPGSGPALGVATVTVLLLCVFDQASTTHITSGYADFAGEWARDRAFVQQAESMLPRGAMVLQLPHTEVPIDSAQPPMVVYDHGRAYLHSRWLRWSWGGIRGRDGDWPREVAFMPPRELAPRAARAGFSAIWIDRFGYSDRARRLVERLGEAAGSAPVESEDGRLVLVNLAGLQRRLESTLGPEGLAKAREEALRVPLVPRWGEGCDDEEETGERFARWCDSTARLFLKNTLDVERRVTLRAGLRATEDLHLSISGRAFKDAVKLTPRETNYERALVLSPRERIRIDLEASGATEANACGRARFAIVDLRVSEGT